MKRIVSMILALLMIVSVGCFGVFAEDVTVTFLGVDGETVLQTISVASGNKLSEDQQKLIPKKDNTNGVYDYQIESWTKQGEENVYDPADSTISSNITFVPLKTTRFGTIFTRPTAVKLNGTEPAEVMPESVPMDDVDALTFVFKVEGADQPMVADRFFVKTNGGALPHWQWVDPNWSKLNWTPDAKEGDFEPDLINLTNGYHFIYLGANLYGQNNYKVETSVDNFQVFATAESAALTSNFPKPTVTREPKNENTNATITMLAVLPDELQPTVTFLDASGSKIGSYKHEYVKIEDVTVENGQNEQKETNYYTIPRKELLNSYPNANMVYEGEKLAGYYWSDQRGDLLSPAEIFEKAGYDAPTMNTEPKEGYKWVLTGWEDENGNLVDAVYDNITVKPHFEQEITDPVTVTFTNYDGKTVDTVIVPKNSTLGDVTVTEPSKPAEGKYSYLFKGWTTDQDKTIAATDEQATEYVMDLAAITASEDMTLYAVYQQVDRLTQISFYDKKDGQLLGSVSVSEGKLVGTVPSAPAKESITESDFTPDGWEDENGTLIIDQTGALVATLEVGQDVTVYPRYKAVPRKYTVTFTDEDQETELGKVQVDYGTAATAPTVTKAEDDYYTYAFDKWLNLDGTEADISSVTADIEVFASYTKTFKNPYEDADLSRYYGKAVEYVTANGIMNGTDATHFSPNGTATRGMIVTVLYRMEGSPNVEGMENKFTDVPEGKYYTDAVKWASNKGVVNGTSDDKFSPDNNVTREQFATMIYRYADEVKNYYMSAGNATLGIFADKNDISTYAINAVKWAIASEKDMTGQGITYYNKTALIEGVRVDENTLNMNPKGNASRAQMATMLERFITGDHLAG